MADPRCVDYIRNNKDRYPLETLKQALLKAGASAADVEEAVQAASLPPAGPAPAVAVPVRIMGPEPAPAPSAPAAGALRLLAWFQALSTMGKAGILGGAAGGILLLALLLPGSTARRPAGLSPARSAAAARPEGLDEAMQAMIRSWGMLGADGNIKAAEPADLKALLPKDLAGLTPAGSSSSRQQAGPMEMSGAMAAYAAVDGRRVSVRIIDTASFSPLLDRAWAAESAEQKSSAGFKRAAEFQGWPAIEEFSEAPRTASLRVAAHQRFVLEAAGSGTDLGALRSALAALDLRALGLLAR